jgi:hypothetical protein
MCQPWTRRARSARSHVEDDEATATSASAMTGRFYVKETGWRML